MSGAPVLGAAPSPRRHLPLWAGLAVVLATAVGFLAASRPVWVAGAGAALAVPAFVLAAAVGARAALLTLLPLAALAGVGLAAVWPSLTVVLTVVIAVVLTVRRAPVYSFALALLLVAFEGTVKVRLALEGAPSPRTLGAALIDVALFVAIAGLVALDGGKVIKGVWANATRFERGAFGLLGVWFAISVLQIVQSGDVVAGVQGFRLSQAYALAVLAGLVLFTSGVPEQRVAHLLLLVMGVVGAYAAIRTVTGPSGSEVSFAAERTVHVAFGDSDRALGSFSSVFGLASFVAPAAVFGLILFFLRSQDRLLSGVVFVTSAVGAVGSYVRTALVAIAAGAAFLAAMLLRGAGVGTRVKVVAVATIVVLVVAGVASSVVTSDTTGSDLARERAQGLRDPLEDESLSVRWETWKRAGEAIGDQPFGAGLGTVGHATYGGGQDSDVFTDNSYLKVTREQGILVGLVFVLGLLGIFGAIARRLARDGPMRHPIGVAALGGFGAFLVLAVMAEYFEQPGKVLAWTLLGIAIWDAFIRAPAPPARTWGRARATT